MNKKLETIARLHGMRFCEFSFALNPSFVKQNSVGGSQDAEETYTDILQNIFQA
jgi:hypothetical protein